MKYVSTHPVEYLRAHLVYEQIRISILFLLTSPKILPIILIAIVLGGLYNILAQVNNVGTVSVEEAYTAQLPKQLPELVLDPMVAYPVFSITF
jgi:hypothetical protein